MKTNLFILLSICFHTVGTSQDKSPNLLQDLLQRSEDPIVRRVLSSPDTFHHQIIYEEIERDEKGKVRFKRHAFNVDPQLYFYPASTIKMANSVVALEKLHATGLSPWLTFHTDSSRYPQKRVTRDTTAKDGIPTIAHYIEMIFVISDNEASNRLYEFIGQKELHQRLKKRGFKETRIVARLADFRFTPDDNRFTNPIYLLHKNDTIYYQPEREAKPLRPLKLKLTKRGLGYMDNQDSLVHKPFDFSQKNFFPLEEQINMVKTIMFPESLPERKRFNIDKSSMGLLRKSMSTLPRELEQPVLDTTEYYDSYCKFFLFGDSRKPIPDHFRIYNKVGWAYGFLTDAAYIVDTKNNIEFLLAGTIEVNLDQIFNDDTYEFDSIGKPFLAEVGRIIYAYELKKRKN